MLSFESIFVVAICCTMFHPISGKKIAKEVDGSVELVGKGKTVLIIPDPLTITMPKSCKGVLMLCYVTKSELGGDETYDNADTRCPSDSCLINFDPENAAASSELIHMRSGDNVVATFDKSRTLICPLKTTNGRQTFTILELPQCSVVVNGASLPTADSKDKNDEKDDKAEDVSDAPEEKRESVKCLLAVVQRLHSS